MRMQEVKIKCDSCGEEMADGPVKMQVPLSGQFEMTGPVEVLLVPVIPDAKHELDVCRACMLRSLNEES